MSEIKVGDLVVIIKPIACCGYSSGIGRIFRVSEFTKGKAGDVCPYCHSRKPAITIALFEGNGHIGAEISRLKKLDPPTEDETVSTDTEITA